MNYKSLLVSKLVKHRFSKPIVGVALLLSVFGSFILTSSTNAQTPAVALKPESFVLVNSSGQAKTSFLPNEPIYVKLTISNLGTAVGVSGITTQIYKHQPQVASVNTKDVPEFSLLHGAFYPTPISAPNLYQSTPGHSSLNRFTTPTRYFSQSAPGTYTARVFVDATSLESRDSKADNQRTATYTIAGTTPAPTPEPSVIPPAANTNVNLVVESFTLTNSAGLTKTSFVAGEPIYVRSAIRNVGTGSNSAISYTQYYANQPATVAVGSKNNPEISTQHGTFTPTTPDSPFVYESRPNGTRVTQFTPARSFTQVVPGTYTARVFADATNALPEFNEIDNQRVVTYTITAPPVPNPSPWPPSTVWPQPVQDPSNILAIVNKKFRLPSTYIPANLRTVNIPFINNQPLRNDTASALEQMNREALGRGIRMHLRSGYRSYGTQQTLYNNYVAQYGTASADTFSARPGHSEHQSGLSFDLGDRDQPGCDLAACFAATKSGVYVAQNAHRFGFIVRYPKGKDAITGYIYEPWHLRYVGIASATAIYNSGLTMEEYYNVPGGGY